MTPIETLNRPARTYAQAVADVIASCERSLAVTKNPNQRIALQDALGRLRRILAEEEAR